jgi:hypothetical protein
MNNRAIAAKPRPIFPYILFGTRQGITLPEQRSPPLSDLSYDEVVYKIPYRNLVMMQKDKLRVVYGDVKKEATPEEMFGDRFEEKFR